MSKTYVIGDLHGRFDLLEKALLAIVEHSGTNEATIIALGDYVDRGLQSKQVIDRLMEFSKKKYAILAKLICLKGNHEEIMFEACKVPGEVSWWQCWLGNGGGQTLMSYGAPARGPIDLSIVPKAHLDWIDKLPYTELYALRLDNDMWLAYIRLVDGQWCPETKPGGPHGPLFFHRHFPPHRRLAGRLPHFRHQAGRPEVLGLAADPSIRCRGDALPGCSRRVRCRKGGALKRHPHHRPRTITETQQCPDRSVTATAAQAMTAPMSHHGWMTRITSVRRAMGKVRSTRLRHPKIFSA